MQSLCTGTTLSHDCEEKLTHAFHFITVFIQQIDYYFLSFRGFIRDFQRFFAGRSNNLVLNDHFLFYFKTSTVTTITVNIQTVGALFVSPIHFDVYLYILIYIHTHTLYINIYILLEPPLTC